MKFTLKVLLLILPFFSMAQDWQMKQAPLMTNFSQDIDPENVLPEYPRPQLERSSWKNLNGIWQFQPGIGAQDPLPAGDLTRRILVPFAIESAISGVMEHHPRIWYRRHFIVPESWNGQRIRLNFGAVDYEAEVFINGTS
ncbi:sugar-binding domain-containing protein, partial [Sunxiuqinia dokdonensis]|uniref:sugar-binding domain-containing protein n=1 Tax=Sunxiuqinia dokdonensis TaxID=1409788 RepID=UPI000AD496F1